MLWQQQESCVAGKVWLRVLCEFLEQRPDPVESTRISAEHAMDCLTSRERVVGSFDQRIARSVDRRLALNDKLETDSRAPRSTHSDSALRSAAR